MLTTLTCLSCPASLFCLTNDTCAILRHYDPKTMHRPHIIVRFSGRPSPAGSRIIVYGKLDSDVYKCPRITKEA